MSVSETDSFPRLLGREPSDGLVETPRIVSCCRSGGLVGGICNPVRSLFLAHLFELFTKCHGPAHVSPAMQDGLDPGVDDVGFLAQKRCFHFLETMDLDC